MFPLLLGKEPNKKHLMQLLHPIRNDWENIGEQLEVPHDDIVFIRQSNIAHDNTRKLSDVLQVWKNRKTCEYSWRKIITVIDNPPVEEKRVADEICDFLARPETMNEYLSSDQSGKIKMIIIDKAILYRIVLEDPDNIGLELYRLYY